MNLQKTISETRNEGTIGSRKKVIIDREEDGMFVGRTEWDAPEIDQEVFVQPGTGLAIGKFCEVEITGAVEYDLYARIATTNPE
jgi:ribosomal protein S12 methylthiotransferase